jgi:hypothetical protein
MTNFVDGLRSAMAGAVLTPGDAGYAEARRVWNADIDHHPAVIAHRRSAADVVAAVRFAAEASGWRPALADAV